MTDEAAARLLRRLETTRLEAADVAARTAAIHADVIGKSNYLDGPNFTRVNTADLKRLFEEYDRDFFQGEIAAALGATPLTFGLSGRMTSSGGKTAKNRNRLTGRVRYEISVSTAILFECFRDDDHREIIACGITCRDRFDAMQRVMEHEITHLIEMMLWDKSSCDRPRFQTITRNVFAHTENRHKLITPRERVVVKYGIQPGMLVRFRFEGAEHTGVVNRITRRATVLVENPKGRRYSNGKYYLKFYVPAAALTPVG